MIKVQITDKVGAIFQDGVKHLPGEIIEIPAKSFRPDHYRKLEPETPKEKTVAAKPAKPQKTEEPPAAPELPGVPIVLKKETSDEEKAETAEKGDKAQRKKTA